MPILAGQNVQHAIAGMVTPALSGAMHGFAVDYWPSHATSVGGSPNGLVAQNFPVVANPRAIDGDVARSYLLDFYFRVQLNPIAIALGNLVSQQQRPVSVWNAWPTRTVTIDSIVTDPDSAITVTGQADPPLDLAPLQERVWQLNIGNTGSATIDTYVQWLFAGDPPLRVHITGQRVTAWTFVPNWNNGLTERLEFMTLVERGTNGNETSTPLRETPRRSWEFQPLVEGTDRQLMEAMLFDASARLWAVPVWPDKTALASPLAAGSSSIPLDTAALDYHDGGLALLRISANSFETVEIETVHGDALILARPTLAAWPAGVTIYPARAVRLDDYPTLNRYTTRLVDSTVRFVSTDANAYAAAMPDSTYRGYPVLEDRPEWSNNPTTQYMRDVELIDNDTGVVQIDDVSGLPWPVQSHRWQVYDRMGRDRLRKLIYALNGQVARLWLPTWQDDLYPSADASSTTLDVQRCGYTAYLHGQPGRRDIRVQLGDGTVLYRRIVASAELSTTVERLQVDAVWPSTLPLSDIASISFMGLCRLDADAVEITHWTDSQGPAACAVNFAQVTGNG